MTWDYKIALIIHVFSAIVWAGGVLFIGIVTVPVLRKMRPEARVKLMTGLGERFRTVGWTMLMLLILTGSYMMWSWGARFDNIIDGSFFSHGHTSLLGKKLIAVVFMLGISGLHDWYLGPLASQKDLDDAQRERYRKVASWLGRVTALLVIGIVALAIFVARPWV